MGWLTDRYVPPVLALSLLCSPSAHSSNPADVRAALAVVLVNLEMVDVPAGSFRMGDLSSEPQANELPVRELRVEAFRIGRFEVSVAQYRAFASVTGHSNSAGCYVLTVETGRYSFDAKAGWSQPGYSQKDDDPVGCISWNDAQAFVEWLSSETGRAFRLPTEMEWEYAARAGSTTSFPWGDAAEEGCHHANGADKTPWPGGQIEWTGRMDCRDNFFWVAPVGSFRANAFGLFDMIGNVWEWTSDCWTERHEERVEAQRSASDICLQRVYRGGAWNMSAANLRSAYRGGLDPTFRNAPRGFRVAESLPP